MPVRRAGASPPRRARGLRASSLAAMLAHAHEDACHRREGAAGLRPRRRRRARRNRPDRARLGAADDRRERRLPGPLPACRRLLRGRADQHRRRHGRRRPHVDRGRHRRGRPGGRSPPRPPRSCTAPTVRTPRSRSTSRSSPEAGSTGCPRSRSCSTARACGAGSMSSWRRRGCPDARRERGVRPRRDGRGRAKAAASATAGASAATAGWSSPRTCGSKAPSANPRAPSGRRRAARALATVLHSRRDAEARRDAARAALEGARCECGVGAWNGMLVARFLSPEPQALRADLVRFLELFRGTPMPRSWQT